MECPHCSAEISVSEVMSALGKKSGKNMTKEERSERAKKAVHARWNKDKRKV